MSRTNINRRLGQGRGVGQAPASSKMNNTHTALVSLPFEADATATIITGTSNKMEIHRVTTSDLFRWAPRLGATLKYNNAEIVGASVISVPTASLSTIGSHCVWLMWDQQQQSWPAGADADAKIAAVIQSMRQSGDHRISSATGKIYMPANIPNSIKGFNFQDVVATTGGQTYDPTTVCHLVRIYPKEAVPITSTDLKVKFTGVGGIIAATTPPTVPTYDVKFPVSGLTLDFMKIAFDELARGIPTGQPRGRVEWKNVLIVVSEAAGARETHVWKKDGMLLQSDWEFVYFPTRTESGRLWSTLSELCCEPVDDPRLDDAEMYYVHSNDLDWGLDDEIIGTLYERLNVPKMVNQRTADEVLQCAYSNHALNVNVGQLAEVNSSED